MNSQLVLQISLAVYDLSGGRTSAPSYTLYAPASFPANAGVTVQPGGMYSFFDGTRAVAVDSTTVFTFTLSPLDVDPVFRFTWTGGTAPSLRTARSVDLTGQSPVLTLNANETLTAVAAAGSFASAQVADEVFIPGVSTGDPSGPFSEANVGLWVVLSRTSTMLQLARPASIGFSGMTEVVSVTTPGEFQVFSPGPVRVGDSVMVVAGFSVPLLRSYVVSAVTPTWFEIVASDPLPSLEVGVPGQVPVIFYSSSRKLCWLQFDQEASVVSNGATLPLSPPTPGVLSGQWLATGPIHSLAVVNRSAQPLRASLWGAS